MKKVSKEDLEKIILFIENGANLRKKELNLFKRTEYFEQFIDLGNGVLSITLKKPINDLIEIIYYPKKIGKTLYYSRNP